MTHTAIVDIVSSDNIESRFSNKSRFSFGVALKIILESEKKRSITTIKINCLIVLLYEI